MLEAGATVEEIRSLRTEERRVLGIPVVYDCLPESLAIDPVLDLAMLTIDHEYTSAVNDFLHPTHGGPEPTNTLIITPTKVTFSGSGGVVCALDERFRGWKGGRLPTRGFWGQHRATITETPQQITALVQELLRSSQP